MFKRTGLGITCLALAFSAYCGSGYCRASVIDTCDTGKHDVKCDDKGKHDDCKVDFKSDKDIKDILKDLKGERECDYLKDLKGDKDGKDLQLLITWLKDHSHSFCDIGNKGCDPGPVIGGCHPSPCDPSGGCDPGGCASVPAPAASTMSGFGLAGIMIASWVRSRRSAKSYC